MKWIEFTEMFKGKSFTVECLLNVVTFSHSNQSKIMQTNYRIPRGKAMGMLFPLPYLFVFSYWVIVRAAFSFFVLMFLSGLFEATILFIIYLKYSSCFTLTVTISPSCFSCLDFPAFVSLHCLDCSSSSRLCPPVDSPSPCVLVLSSAPFFPSSVSVFN